MGFFFNNGNNFFINGMFTSVFMIPVIRQILKREYSAKLYRVSTYYVSLCLLLVIPSLLYSAIFSPVCYFSVGLKQDFVSFLYYFVLNTFNYLCGCYFGLFVGAVCGDHLSLIISPFIFILFMLGSGYFRSNDNFPWMFKWLNYVSPYRYMIELYILIEQDYNVITQEIGKKLGYTKGLEACMLILGGYLALGFIMGFIALKLYASKF